MTSEEITRLLDLAKTDSPEVHASCALQLAQAYLETRERDLLQTLICLRIGLRYEGVLRMKNFVEQYDAAIGLIGKTAVLDLIELLKNSPDRKVRSRAALALKTIAKDHAVPEAIEPLRESLLPGGPEVREYALAALGEIGARSDISSTFDEVISMLADERPLVDTNAALVLEKFGGEREKLFKRLVYDKDEKTVDAIGFDRVIEVFAAFEELAKRDQDTVRAHQKYRHESVGQRVFKKICDYWFKKKMKEGDIVSLVAYGELFAERILDSIDVHNPSGNEPLMTALEQIVAKYGGTPELARLLISKIEYCSMYSNKTLSSNLSDLLEKIGANALDVLAVHIGANFDIKHNMLDLFFKMMLKYQEGPTAFVKMLRAGSNMQSRSLSPSRFLVYAAEYLEQHSELTSLHLWVTNFRQIVEVLKKSSSIEEQDKLMAQVFCSRLYGQLVIRVNSGKGIVDLGSGVLSEGLPKLPRQRTFQAVRRACIRVS